MAGEHSVLRDSIFTRHESLANADAAQTLPWGDGQTLKFGLALQDRQRSELRRQFDNAVEQVSGSLGQPYAEKSRRLSAFVQNSWEPLPRWTLLAGLRFEHWHLSATS